MPRLLLFDILIKGLFLTKEQIEKGKFMAKFHIKKDGTPGQCHALKGSCPLGGVDSHFETSEAAQVSSQNRLESQFGTSGGLVTKLTENELISKYTDFKEADLTNPNVNLTEKERQYLLDTAKDNLEKVEDGKGNPLASPVIKEKSLPEITIKTKEQLAEDALISNYTDFKIEDLNNPQKELTKKAREYLLDTARDNEIKGNKVIKADVQIEQISGVRRNGGVVDGQRAKAITDRTNEIKKQRSKTEDVHKAQSKEIQVKENPIRQIFRRLFRIG